MIRFLWNGLKTGDKIGLQRAWYSRGEYGPASKIPAGSIVIYAKEYKRFSAEVRENMDVRNDSDSMSDYFENDRIVVTPDHKLFAKVDAAEKLQQAHQEKREAFRKAKFAQGRAGL